MAQTPRNAINWFEIPVQDIERAQRFYEALLDTPLQRMDMGDYKMVMLPADDGGVSGCLSLGEDCTPSANSGTTVYINAEPSLDAMISRVENAGGKVTIPRTEIDGGHGFFAHILDSEGNRIGLHAMQ